MEDTRAQAWEGISEEQWRDRLFQHRMNSCKRAWRAGSPDAVNDALTACHEFGHPPPRWLLQAVRAMAAEIAAITDGPGEINSPRKIFDRHLIDYMRYDAVEELKDRKDELLGNWGDDRGKTQQKRWRAVSDVLANTPAAAGPDAIRKSYYRVRRNIKSGQAGLYYVPKRGPTGVLNPGS